MTGCDECGSVSAHLRGCTAGELPGLALGKRRRRSSEDQAVYDETKRALARVCALCGKTGQLTAHHIIPRQRGEARGMTAEQIDAASNVVALCLVCHGFEHGTEKQKQHLRDRGLLDDG